MTIVVRQPLINNGLRYSLAAKATHRLTLAIQFAGVTAGFSNRLTTVKTVRLAHRNNVISLQ